MSYKPTIGERFNYDGRRFEVTSINYSFSPAKYMCINLSTGNVVVFMQLDLDNTKMCSPVCGPLMPIIPPPELTDDQANMPYKVNPFINIITEKTWSNEIGVINLHQHPEHTEASVKEPACECGSAKVGSNKHSDWCPLYFIETYS